MRPRPGRCAATCSAQSTASRSRSKTWSRWPVFDAPTARSGPRTTSRPRMASRPGASGGRRRAARQDQHAALWLQGHVRQLPGRSVQESLEVGSDLWRVVRWSRGVGRGRPRTARARLGRRRVGADPGRALRHLRHEAVVRARSVRPRRRLLGRPFARRSDDPHRPRWRDAAWDHGRPGRSRPALGRRPGAGLPGGVQWRRQGTPYRLEPGPQARPGRSGGAPDRRACRACVRRPRLHRRGGQPALGRPVRVAQDDVRGRRLRSGRRPVARASRSGSRRR